MLGDRTHTKTSSTSSNLELMCHRPRSHLSPSRRIDPDIVFVENHATAHCPHYDVERSSLCSIPRQKQSSDGQAVHDMARLGKICARSAYSTGYTSLRFWVHPLRIDHATIGV